MLHACVETVAIGEQSVNLSISIEHTYRTTIDFSVHNRTYTFVVSKWQGNGFSRFFSLFHQHVPRDAEMFGETKQDAEGLVSYVSVNLHQKLNAVIQAAKDIIGCLNAILRVHGRGILDYAVWYRETRAYDDTYSRYITKVACHCIVHGNFLAPSVKWDVVEFK